jgi:hypothetical protein
VTEEVNPAAYKKWFSRRERVLQEADIANEFKDYKQTAQNLLEAQKTNKDFQKKAFSKMIDIEPEAFFEKIFKTENPTREVISIMQKFGGDSAAVQGMRNSFKEYVWDQVAKESKGRTSFDADKFNELMKRFEKPMKAIFAGNEQQLDAMRNARKIIDVLSRNSTEKSGDLIPKGWTLKAMKSFLPFIFPKYSMVSGARGLADIGSMLSRGEIGDMLVRAAFDWDFANRLRNASTRESMMGILDEIKFPKLGNLTGNSPIRPSIPTALGAVAPALGDKVRTEIDKYQRTP